MFEKEKRQRLFLGAQIRKEVQAEEDREELDTPQLAFIVLQGSEEDQTEEAASRKIIGNSPSCRHGCPLRLELMKSILRDLIAVATR